MVIGVKNSAYLAPFYGGVNTRALDNFFAGQRLVSKAAELVSVLESTRNPASFDLDSLYKTDIQKAQETLDQLIKDSIKEITDIRKSRGIAQADVRGQNKPLEELFSAIKGSVFEAKV